MINELQTVATCLHFEEISEDDINNYKNQEHIKFTNLGDQFRTDDGCWSYVGKQGGEQVR